MAANGELERTWKEAVVTYFKILYKDVFGGLRETTKNLRIPGLLAEIRISDLPHTCP
jgi:hypothetical protein